MTSPETGAALRESGTVVLPIGASSSTVRERVEAVIATHRNRR